MRALHLSCGGSESETRQRSARVPLRHVQDLEGKPALESRLVGRVPQRHEVHDRHAVRRSDGAPNRLLIEGPDPAGTQSLGRCGKGHMLHGDRHVHYVGSEPRGHDALVRLGARDHHDRGLGNEGLPVCRLFERLAGLGIANHHESRLLAVVCRGGEARGLQDPQQRRLLHGPIKVSPTAIPTRNDVVELHSRLSSP